MQKVPPLKSNEILFEDNHLLVINKRAGLATMGAESGKETLLSLSREYIRRKYNKPGNVYLGTVSRLDAFTTGAIVFARTSKAAARLTSQFKNRETRKTYWALVESEHPEPIEDIGELDDLMFKDESAMRMRCVPHFRSGTGKKIEHAKRAKLTWKRLATVDNRHLLEVDLQTGRKHQIRCQFAFAGFPVVGDAKYGSKSQFRRAAIALHSKIVEITHPTRKIVQQFEAPVPDYWKLERFNL